MLISAIITTRNRAALVREAINSVFAQEECGADVEVIVVDDDSSDETPGMIAGAYPSVRYIRTKQGTAAGSRNVGMEAAKGDWFAFLDDDDIWLPHKLRVFCAAIRRDAEANRGGDNVRLIQSSATICDWDLNPIGVWEAPPLQNYSSTFEAYLDVVMTPSAVLMHREVVDKVGFFDPSEPRIEDRDLWLRIALAGLPCQSLPDQLSLYRVRAEPRGDEIYKDFQGTMRVVKRHFAHNKRVVSRAQKVKWLFKIQGEYFSQLKRNAGYYKISDQSKFSHYERLAFVSSPMHYLKSLVLG